MSVIRLIPLGEILNYLFVLSVLSFSYVRIPLDLICLSYNCFSIPFFRESVGYLYGIVDSSWSFI